MSGPSMLLFIQQFFCCFEVLFCYRCSYCNYIVMLVYALHLNLKKREMQARAIIMMMTMMMVSSNSILV